MLVAGGARGLRRALPRGEAAQRTGAGYVTACVPAAIETVFEVRLLEVMTRGLPDDDGAHTEAGVDAVLELARRGGALIAGPGLGRTDGAQAFVRRLVREAEVAVVLDADGLNAHAGDLGRSPRGPRRRSSRPTRANWGGSSESTATRSRRGGCTTCGRRPRRRARSSC